MGNAFLYGANGSAALNFRIIGGTTQPQSPRENDIWVNTSVPINGWIFSAEQPSNASEGMVWIKTGISSLNEFNALKKNAIQLYPNAVKIYTGSSWTNAESKIWRNGQWVDILGGTIFENGVWYYDQLKFTNAGGTITDGMTTGIQVPNVNSACAYIGAYVMLSGANTLSVEYSDASWNTGNEFTHIGVFVSDENPPDPLALCYGAPTYAVAAKLVSDPGVSGTITLDVSSVNGEYYVWFGGYVSAGGGTLQFNNFKVVYA